VKYQYLSVVVIFIVIFAFAILKGNS